MILYKKPRLRDRAPTRPSEIRARRPRRTSRPYRWLDGVWVAGGCAPDGEGGACDGTPCGEGGASVCAPDGEGGAGGAPCGDWRGQRTARASAHPLWRGRRERGRARWRLARAARAWWATVQKPRVATTFRLRAISTTSRYSDAVTCTSTLPNGRTAGRCRTRVCDNGSNVAQESDLALLEP